MYQFNFMLPKIVSYINHPTITCHFPLLHNIFSKDKFDLTIQVHFC